MGVAKHIIEEDRRLQTVVAKGEAAAESLGELRYRACVVEGCTQAEYAEAVGVTQQAVGASIARYRTVHPDLYNPVVQTGNDRVDAQRERRERERASAPEREPVVAATRSTPFHWSFSTSHRRMYADAYKQGERVGG